MCRSIHPLHNYSPPTTSEEVRAAAVQYVRKVSGMTRPAAVNQEAFDRAVAAVTSSTEELLALLVASSPPHDRAVERERARTRWEHRAARDAVAR